MGFGDLAQRQDAVDAHRQLARHGPHKDVSGPADQFAAACNVVPQRRPGHEERSLLVDETKLYLDTLIPESRGDVLGLLESTDRVLNRMAETLAQFDIEMPEIFDDFKPQYLDLTDAAMSTVEFMVSAVRAYFREPDKVRDYINKAMFYEKQSDSVGDRIKRNVFRTDLRAEQKGPYAFFHPPH